jgi:hypothetical protein
VSPAWRIRSELLFRSWARSVGGRLRRWTRSEEISAPFRRAGREFTRAYRERQRGHRWRQAPDARLWGLTVRLVAILLLGLAAVSVLTVAWNVVFDDPLLGITMK